MASGSRRPCGCASTVWDQAAERVAEQLRKGNKIYAEGELRAREYERNDGSKGTSLELRFARVVNLERRSRDESEGGFADAPAGGSPAARPRGGRSTLRRRRPTR